MANTRELRRRIKSVKNTAQITKAMQMVSATKMRRAQNQALSGRPYTSTLANVLNTVSGRVDPANHPLLLSHSSTKSGVLLVSTDKGLAGALNTNLFRLIQSPTLLNGKKQEDISFYTVGKKGRDFIVRTGRNLTADFENPEKINFSEAKRIRKVLLDAFFKQEVGEVYLLYPDFISTLRQEPKLVKILPIDVGTMLGEKEKVSSFNSAEMVFEPSPGMVLDYALTHHIDTQIYQALVETRASEHSARMIAMQNATNNALDLVEDLQLTYNQVRQSAITTELLEITSASAALE